MNSSRDRGILSDKLIMYKWYKVKLHRFDKKFCFNVERVVLHDN